MLHLPTVDVDFGSGVRTFSLSDDRGIELDRRNLWNRNSLENFNFNLKLILLTHLCICFGLVSHVRVYIFPLLPLVGIWALMEINLTVSTNYTGTNRNVLSITFPGNVFIDRCGTYLMIIPLLDFVLIYFIQ